jgi:cytochrome P450
MTEPFDAVDFSDPGTSRRDDYFDMLAELRARAGLPEYEQGARVVARYADIREISRDPARFCSGRGVLINDPLREGGSIEGSILHLDPPRHAAYRKLLNREFTTRAVGRMEDRVRMRTRSLLDAIPPTDEVDTVDTLTAPLPVMVIADVLGIPESERSEFRRWSDATILASDFRAELPADALQAVIELSEFLTAHAERRRNDPGDDVVSLLVQSEVEGAPLSTGELLTFNMSLLVAGNETTRHLLTGALVALAEHPDQRARLANEPEAIPGAIEECLRWVTPIQQFARTVVADTTVGGVEVRADEYLLMIYASGNRDESAFGPTADEFDAFRPVTTPNLAFGFGEHLCLGAALARLEARVFLEEMLARFPEYEVTGPGEYVRSNLVRGYESLPFRTG